VSSAAVDSGNNTISRNGRTAPGFLNMFPGQGLPCVDAVQGGFESDGSKIYVSTRLLRLSTIKPTVHTSEKKSE
jgi:hypothetical protein